MPSQTLTFTVEIKQLQTPSLTRKIIYYEMINWNPLLFQIDIKILINGYTHT